MKINHSMHPRSVTGKLLRIKFGLWDQSRPSPVWEPQRHVAWVVGPQHLLFTPQACSCRDKPLVPTGLATDVWWHGSQWYVHKTVPDLNQLWNCYFFNSLTPLLLLNCNTGPISYSLAEYHNLSLQYLYYITPFFTFFKGKLSSISVSSHMGNFTCPFPFLPPLSELCLALVQVSSETWEYWVTNPAYIVPNVNASSTLLIACMLHIILFLLLLQSNLLPDQ